MISIIEPTLKPLGKGTSTNGDTFYGKKIYSMDQRTSYIIKNITT